MSYKREREHEEDEGSDWCYEEDPEPESSPGEEQDGEGSAYEARTVRFSRGTEQLFKSLQNKSGRQGNQGKGHGRKVRKH